MAYRVTSEVVRIYPADSECVYIRLKDPSHTPKDGYFELKTDHPNFKALYVLALVAAANRQKLQIRTVGDIVSTEHAEVLYMVLDW